MLRAVAAPEAVERLASQIKESPMGEVRVPVRVANPDAPDRSWEADFLVDSGASVSVVPVDVLNQLGIDARRLGRFYLANESSIVRRVGLATFTVAGETEDASVMFGEEGSEPILGLTVLQSLGFLVDPLRERLLPRSALAEALD